MKKMYNSIDKPLFIAASILFGIGLLMILSASTTTQLLRYGESGPFEVLKYCIQQVVFITGTAFLSYIFILKRPMRRHYHMALLLMGFIIGSLILVKVWGATTNNAQSWIPLIAGFRFQPSEFAKPIIILYLAFIISKLDYSSNNFRPLFWATTPIMFILVLVLLQPDFGTAMILTALAGIILLIAPISKEIKLKATSVALLSVILFAGAVLIVNPGAILGEKMRRLTAFQDPCADYYHEGLQVCNSLIAINSADLWGTGPTGSTQKNLYLPEAHTDFIMAITIEELGLIGFSIILFLYYVILYRLFIIAKKCKTTSNAIVAYGVAAYIFIHLFINLGGISALIPLTGVPLPFLSYGGSYTVSLVIAIALALRVSHENKLSS